MKRLIGRTPGLLALVALATIGGATALAGAGPPVESLSESLSEETPTGSLAIRAVLRTDGGPPVAGASVQVRLVHRGIVVDTIDTRLDEHGVILLEDIPLRMSVQPVVTIEYAGVRYQHTGEIMDAVHPQRAMDVVCYETTEEAPAWSVRMRHLMLARAPAGVRVTEIIVIDNPSERTWIGAAGPNEGDRRTTSVFSLPAGARDLTLGKGFHDWCCSTFAGGRLVNNLPLMPSRTEFEFSYVVDAADGAATLEVSAPRPVARLMLIIPGDMLAASPQGLARGGEQAVEGGTVEYYVANDLAADETVGITLTNLSGAPAADEAGSMTPAQLIAALGGGLLLVVALVLLLPRRVAAPASAPGIET